MSTLYEQARAANRAVYKVMDKMRANGQKERSWRQKIAGDGTLLQIQLRVGGKRFGTRASVFFRRGAQQL
jgi:chemotaxis receptor (MCP) glutamine deamidase CheD